MNPLYYNEVQQVLNAREDYYKGLKTTGSHHDQQVSMHALLIIRSLKKDFDAKFKETR
tara:strand:+ start:376 stop:549 length:174 start_codon:yes stop_codon:yes gene_type:complete